MVSRESKRSGNRVQSRLRLACGSDAADGLRNRPSNAGARKTARRMAPGEPRMGARRGSLKQNQGSKGGVRRMQESEIHDYARQLLEAHGGKAVAEAAQKAADFERR